MQKRGKRLGINRLVRILLAASLVVGFSTALPAKAQAPKFTESMLAPKAFAKVKIKRAYAKANAEYACLVKLWNNESHWNPRAYNHASGAFGIAQFLPQTWSNYKYPYMPRDPHIQITAGLRYITVRYGTPCNALAFWNRNKWY